MKSKKTILILYPGFLHYRDGIIEELINNGKNEYHFAGDKNGYNKIKPFDFKGYKYFYDLPSYNVGPFYFNKGLIKLIMHSKIHFDGAIVHSSPYWISIILATILLRLKGKKVYNWTHGILSDTRSLKNYFYYTFYSLTFNGLLLYGNHARKHLENFGFRNNRMKVIYNSLNYKDQLKFRDSLADEERINIRAGLFSKPDRFQLIFIGRLTRQKKLNLLLEALLFLKRQGTHINLLMVGDGQERTHLEQYAIDNNLKSQIYFYGANYEESINYRLIASSDCCVAPGEIGLTAMHSLMYGVPVISHGDVNSQMPEFESIKHGINGMLFEKDNVYDLAAKIKELYALTLAKTPSKVREDCYNIIDNYYNPEYQLKLIDSLFQ